MSIITGWLTQPQGPKTDPLAMHIVALPGLFVKLTNDDTAESVVSSEKSAGTGGWWVTRPSPGTYELWTSPTGGASDWTDTGQKINIEIDSSVIDGKANDAAVMHLVGQETVDGQKDFNEITAQGPILFVDSPAFGPAGIDASITAAFRQAALKGGEVVFSPGRTYLTNGIQAVSNVKVKAKGAIISHIGTGVLLQVGQPSTSTKHFEWESGTLIANQAPGTTTDVINVQNSIYCMVQPDGIQGGNDPTVPTARYAQNGIHMYGRAWPSPGGNYYNFIGGRATLITGCANQGVFIDGWDPVHSPTQGNFNNDNLYVNLMLQANQAGMNLDGCENETWIGGDCERNVSYALIMGGHPLAVKILGMWYENNNGGESSEQISVDTTTYAPSQQSNTFKGTANTTTQPYWRECETGSSHAWAGTKSFYGTLSKYVNFYQDTVNNPVFAAYLNGDAQPQFRMNMTPSGAQAKYGPGGSTLPDCTFGRLGSKTVGNATGTNLQGEDRWEPPNLGPAAQGTAIWRGSGAPSNSLGGNGDKYERSDTGAHYIKLSGAWLQATISLSGSTRPTLSSSQAGFSMVDTSLSTPRPVWWTGTAWIDATGAGA